MHKKLLILLVAGVVSASLMMFGVRHIKIMLLQKQVETSYLDLLSRFNPDFPGRGKQDYPGSTDHDDYAKSYAVFLSAELNRASSTKPFQLSDIGYAAGYWLLENQDINQDGRVGWGLPVAWDAYGDGTVNPPNTEYTIATGLVINALLDWLEKDPSAPRARIIGTVQAAIEPFLNPELQTITGFIPYSFSDNDRNYDTYNSAIYLVGQVQRFSWLEPDQDKKNILKELADKTMSRVIADHKELPDGTWYWSYSDKVSSPNELAHASYIIDGIRSYITYGGTLASQFDWRLIINHLDLYQKFGALSVYEYPIFNENTYSRPPRLYDLGMYLHIVSLCDFSLDPITKVFTRSTTYRNNEGHYTKLAYSSPANEAVINEYESYILYGWSTILSYHPGQCLSR